MMGHTHALSGLTAWAGLACAAPTIAHVEPHWPAVTAGLLATAGAALLPDLDHPQGNIARTLGPITKALTEIVERVSGGHRHATHSILFAIAMPLLVWAGDTAGGPWFELPALFFLYAFGLRALHLVPWSATGVAAALTGLVGYLMLHDLAWLPWAVGAGIAAHLIGDTLTVEGCPLLWPHRRRYEFPIIRHTGNKLELRIFGPAFAFGALVLLTYVRT